MKYLNSLSHRLTFWYSGVFILGFLAVLLSFYPALRDAIYLWTDKELEAEVTEFGQVYAKSGMPGLTELLMAEEKEEKGQLLVRIMDKRGQIIYQTAPGRLAQVPLDPNFVEKVSSGQQVRDTIVLPGAYDIRVLYAPIQDDLVVQIGLVLREYDLWMRKLSEEVLKASLVALALSVIFGGILVRRTLSPIHRMAQMASIITGRSLGQRMPVSRRGDEVDQLASAFKDMLGRIDILMQGVRQVTDTLAHDLRTPITGMRGMAEIALRTPREPEYYRMTLQRITDQLDRLSSQCTAILDVSAAETGILALHFESVSLDGVAREVLEAFEPVAMDKGLRLESMINNGMVLEADKARLFQVLANLVDNALKHTPKGGRVRLTLEGDRHGKGAFVSVADNGIGIAKRDLPYIFERYYRGDDSRSGPGAGLGLPLVLGIVEAHGGSVTVESELGKGAVFRIFLPRSQQHIDGEVLSSVRG